MLGRLGVSVQGEWAGAVLGEPLAPSFVVRPSVPLGLLTLRGGGIWANVSIIGLSQARRSLFARARAAYVGVRRNSRTHYPTRLILRLQQRGQDESCQEATTSGRLFLISKAKKDRAEELITASSSGIYQANQAEATGSWPLYLLDSGSGWSALACMPCAAAMPMGLFFSGWCLL